LDIYPFAKEHFNVLGFFGHEIYIFEEFKYPGEFQPEYLNSSKGGPLFELQVQLNSPRK